MMNKKNIIRILCCVALAVIEIALTSQHFEVAQAQSGNLVQNPGFETAGSGGAADAANWTEGTNHARASDKFHSGGWSLKSTYTGAGTSTNQTLSVSANTPYTY